MRNVRSLALGGFVLPNQCRRVPEHRWVRSAEPEFKALCATEGARVGPVGSLCAIHKSAQRARWIGAEPQAIGRKDKETNPAWGGRALKVFIVVSARSQLPIPP